MTSPIVHRLENPSEEQINRIVQILVAAFENDPFSAVLTGGNLSLNPLQLAAGTRAAAVGGYINVVSLGSQAEDIVAAAIWFGPGQAINSTEEQRSQGWNTFFSLLTEEAKKWWQDYFVPTTSVLANSTLGLDYSLAAWHLFLLGVAPEYQRKGYAKALVNTVIHEASKSKTPLLVETTTDFDVEIYKRLGFVERAQVSLSHFMGSSNWHIMTIDHDSP